MDAVAIISAATMGINLANQGIGLYVRAVDAANAGDLVTANANLAKARDHFAASKAAWDAAGTPPVV